MGQNSNRRTPFGAVNGTVLDELRGSWDTMRLLEAVDEIDEIRYRLCEPDRLREELLQLHGRAHTLINGAPLLGRKPAAGIWELATDLELELSRFAQKLDEVADLLGELSRLAPEEEWEEEDEEGSDQGS